MGIGAGGACACCNRAAAACICIILYSIKQEPALFLRKQTAILLPLLTWCSASDTRKTDLSAVCESNQLVKRFFFFFFNMSSFSLGPWFLWPLAHTFASVQRTMSCSLTFVETYNGCPFFRPPLCRRSVTLPGRCVRMAPPGPHTWSSFKERVAAPFVRDSLASSCQVVCSRYYVVRVRNGFIICTVNHYQ